MAGNLRSDLTPLRSQADALHGGRRLAPPARAALCLEADRFRKGSRPPEWSSRTAAAWRPKRATTPVRSWTRGLYFGTLLPRTVDGTLSAAEPRPCRGRRVGSTAERPVPAHVPPLQMTSSASCRAATPQRYSCFASWSTCFPSAARTTSESSIRRDASPGRERSPRTATTGGAVAS
jgi:hypothetical protein